jgi:hypothetical protein
VGRERRVRPKKRDRSSREQENAARGLKVQKTVERAADAAHEARSARRLR